MRGSGKIEIDDMVTLIGLLTDPSIKLLNEGKSFTVGGKLKTDLYTLPRKLKDDGDASLRQSKSMGALTIQRYASRNA